MLRRAAQAGKAAAAAAANQIRGVYRRRVSTANRRFQRKASTQLKPPNTRWSKFLPLTILFWSCHVSMYRVRRANVHGALNRCQLCEHPVLKLGGRKKHRTSDTSAARRQQGFYESKTIVRGELFDPDRWKLHLAIGGHALFDRGSKPLEDNFYRREDDAEETVSWLWSSGCPANVSLTKKTNQNYQHHYSYCQLCCQENKL